MRTATEHHARFATLPGSAQIASPFAIEGLRYWCKRRNPDCILELGAGIGTLTQVLLELCERYAQTIDTVEPDLWCRMQLRQNVRDVALHLTIWAAWQSPLITTAWDFVVVDGCDAEVPLSAMILAPRAVVFVEGNRRAQRTALEAGLRRPWIRVQWKADDRSKGFWVYQLEPTLGERLWFAVVRASERLWDLNAWMMGRPIGKRRR